MRPCHTPRQKPATEPSAPGWSFITFSFAQAAIRQQRARMITIAMKRRLCSRILTEFYSGEIPIHTSYNCGGERTKSISQGRGQVT